MLESWFPRNYKLTTDIIIRKVVFAGDDWQIYDCSDESAVLIVKSTLADYWCNNGYIVSALLQKCSFGREQYLFLHSPADMYLAPISYNQDFITYEDGKSFAAALAASRKIDSEVSLSDGIFVEQYSKILPIKQDKQDEPDDILLGRWLSRGTEISANSLDRMMQLFPTVTESGLIDILQTANMNVTKAAVLKEHSRSLSCETSDVAVKAPYSLPGRN